MLYIDLTVNEICPCGFNVQANISSDNGVAQPMFQVIMWTNAGLVL